MQVGHKSSLVDGLCPILVEQLPSEPNDGSESFTGAAGDTSTHNYDSNRGS